MGFFLPVDGDVDGQLVSMLVAEIQPLQQVESEVGLMLASATPSTTVMYIISLGECSHACVISVIPYKPTYKFSSSVY